tara:strand:- start:154 stop:423 length:270 start_codon:yes stop_codon:yes gene_type:complete
MIKFDTDIFFSKLRNEMKDVLKEHDKILDKSNSDEVITEEEASKLLKVSKRTLLNKRKKGELPKNTYFYVGKSARYKRIKLIEYFSSTI